MRQEMQSALCSQHDYVWLLRHAQHVQSPTHCPDQVTRVCYTHPVYVNSRMVVLRSSDTVALQLEWLLGLLVYKHCGQGTLLWLCHRMGSRGWVLCSLELLACS